MKICKYCLMEKELDFFPKTGLKCKECIAIYKKEYAEDNKEKIKKYQKIYQEDNKEKIKENKKIYQEDNKEKIKEKRKVYLEDNKDIIKKNLKEYYIENKDKLLEKQKKYQKLNPRKEYQKEYRINNKESISDSRKNYYIENCEVIKDKIKKYSKENREIINNRNKERRDNDTLYRLKCNIRSLIRISFKNKSTEKSKKTIEILGCDFDTFKKYIEEQFTEEMTWDNYATYWQFDHKTPISWAKTEDEVYELNHYTNFQPLYWVDNYIKGNRWAD